MQSKIKEVMETKRFRQLTGIIKKAVNLRLKQVSKRIPPMQSKEFVKLLTRGGAKFVRQKSTSHAIFEQEKEGRGYRAAVVIAVVDEKR